MQYYRIALARSARRYTKLNTRTRTECECREQGNGHFKFVAVYVNERYTAIIRYSGDGVPSVPSPTSVRIFYASRSC